MIDFSQLREKYNAPYERVELDEGLKDPPPVLVLRRTGIRDFATGERVALYYNAKLKLTFSVPYGATKTVAAVAEETFLEEYLEEIVMRQLQTIVNNNETRDVKFKNNSRTRVVPTTAKNVLDLHSQLSPGNQRKLSSLVSSSAENLSKASAFAYKHLS